mgnify:CR=1 FL=1
MGPELTASSPTSIQARDPSEPDKSFSMARATLAIGALVLAALYAMPWGDDFARAVFGHILLFVLACTAAALCALASRRAREEGRLTWALLAAGAAAVALAQAFEIFGRVGFGLEPWSRSPSPYLHLAFPLLFCAGIARLLVPIPSGRALVDAALDGGVLVAIGTFLILHFGPAPADSAASAGGVDALRILAFASLVALFAAIMLPTTRQSAIPRPAALLLVGATGTFALWNVLAVTGVDPRPFVAGGPTDLLGLAVWTMLASAGLIGARDPEALWLEPRRPLAAVLRHAIAPSAVIFLGLAAAHAAATPGGPGTASTVSLVALAGLLAARIGFTTAEVERRKEGERLYIQNSALIEVSRALAGSTELDNTMVLVSQWAARLLQAGAAGIELMDPDGKTLELRATVGLPENILGLRFSVDRSFTGWVVRHGRPRATTNPTADPFIQPQSRSFLGNSPVAAAPLIFRDRPLGALFACMRNRPFDESDLELLQALADQVAIAIENARLFEQVRALSLTDPLTGLANRRQLERELNREFSAARRGRKLVVVIFDLDGFKEYNDTHGHLAGDDLLRRFANALAAETRAMNLAARYGGDEFVAILSDSDLEKAAVFLDRVNQRFAKEFDDADAVTVSAGMAEYQPWMQSPEDLLAAADAKLYQVKANRPGTRT